MFSFRMDSCSMAHLVADLPGKVLKNTLDADNLIKFAVCQRLANFASPQAIGLAIKQLSRERRIKACSLSNKSTRTRKRGLVVGTCTAIDFVGIDVPCFSRR